MTAEPAAPCGARYTMALELSPAQTGYSPIRQFAPGPSFVCTLDAYHDGPHVGDDGSTTWSAR